MKDHGFVPDAVTCSILFDGYAIASNEAGVKMNAYTVRVSILLNALCKEDKAEEILDDLMDTVVKRNMPCGGFFCNDLRRSCCGNVLLVILAFVPAAAGAEGDAYDDELALFADETEAAKKDTKKPKESKSFLLTGFRTLLVSCAGKIVCSTQEELKPWDDETDMKKLFAVLRCLVFIGELASQNN